jgi:DNA-3-methyladenine glycosylase I
MLMLNFQIRPLSAEDRSWIAGFIRARWGAPQVISRGRLHQVDRLPGFVAAYQGSDRAVAGRLPAGFVAGLITYSIEGPDCEIVSIDSLMERVGIGSALIQSVLEAARAQGCRRVWLITTNDNTPALRFYQRRGFRLVAVHRGAVDQARRIKPQISLLGIDGIPIHDEIELEMLLP